MILYMDFMFKKSDELKFNFMITIFILSFMKF